MAGRPNKVGLDYFELDCHLDDNIKLIQAEFGLKGFAVVVKLFQKIYGMNGYYCEWNDDVLLLFCGENASTCESNLIKNIVAACIRRDIFSEELFQKYGILTSSGIQKRYLNATAKREKVELIKEYLLFVDAKNLKNVVINSISDGRNSINSVDNTQSRVEKSRVEYIKGRRPKVADSQFSEDSFEIRCVNKLIQSCLATVPGAKVPETLEDKQKWAKHIDRMKRLDKRSEANIEKVLNYAINDSFWKSNIRSTSKLREKYETLYAQLNSSKNKSNKSVGLASTRSYDMEELSKMLYQ